MACNHTNYTENQDGDMRCEECGEQVCGVAESEHTSHTEGEIWADPATGWECEECGGKGWVERSVQTMPDSARMDVEVECECARRVRHENR